MGGDGDDVHVYYGTALISEEELNPRKRKSAVDQGQARQVAPWNQEVTDSEGRRRFHGAFSGGFSAGYFNTVGSKEGWSPQTFTSSRQSRADKKAQAAYDFMDEDEKAEFEAKNLEVRAEFDTFGSTAAEYARRQAAKEIGDRPSAIPGPLIDEIVVPVNESIGGKLLRLMGWRRGRQIGPKHIAAASDARREARKAMMTLAQNESRSTISSGPKEFLTKDEDSTLRDDEDLNIEVPKTTPYFVMNPKKDLYGLGFDPLKDAPEFRERKRAREEDGSGHGGWKGHALSLKRPSLFRPNAGKMGGGFGIGALEDLGDEDEDVYDQGMAFEVQESEEDDKPAEQPRKRLIEDPLHKGTTLPGFHIAREPPKKKPWYPVSSPIIPKNFNFVHKFDKPLGSERLQERPAPAAARPPDDLELCKYIEGLASFVAKSGPRLEEISKEKQRENPMFGFLFGGLGHDYYVRRLWEEEQKLVKEGKQQIRIDNVQSERAGRQSNFSPQLDANERGKMLGEIPLPKGAALVQRQNSPVASMVGADDRARLQSALSSVFTSSSTAGETTGNSQPFKDDPAKQNRFEQFLKGKSVGGLWKPTSGGSGLSESERSQEIFEFEAAARLQQEGLTLDKRAPLNAPGKPVPELVAIMGSRFTTAGIATTTRAGAADGKELVLREETKQYPRREENPWRPSPLLCKRFDLLDPFAGKAPPLPKSRSRTESFILLTNPMESSVEVRPPTADATAGQNSGARGPKSSELNHTRDEEPEQIGDEKIEPIPQRPVDLYKAIFSDDSDDEDEETGPSQLSTNLPGDVMKRAEAANAALNRLVAGDFLESLGKELGLKVPEPARPAGDRPAAKEIDGGNLTRSKNNVEQKGGEFGRRRNVSVGAAIDQRDETSSLGRQSRMNGAVAENLHRRESQQNSSRGKPLQTDTSEALFGVRTRHLDMPDETSRWGDDSVNARSRVADTEAKAVRAPSTVTQFEDTEPESDSDKEKALAKKIRREEKRLKREKEKKKKHKHRKDHISSGRKKEKRREKEGRHHRKHKRRRSESSSENSSSS